MNINLLASSVKAFPSSNDHVNDGKVTNEINLRTMINRLKILNYKRTATDLQLSVNGTDLGIATGLGSINGTFVEVSTALSVDCSSVTDGDYFVYINLVYDASGNIKSNSGTVTEGITCAIETTEQTGVNYLYLGTLNVASGTLTVTSSTNNIYPYDLSSFPNPTGDNTLQNFLSTSIPNTYVSKVANDSKIGNLEFTGSGTKKVTITNTSVGVSDSGTNTLTITDNYISKTGVNTEPRVQIKSDSVDMIYGDSKATVKNTGTSSEINLTTVEYDENNNATNHTIKVTDSDIQIDDLSIVGDTITVPTLTVDGDFTATGDIHANRVYNAVYNGFGEYFEKDPNEIIEYGDVVCIREDGLVHKVSIESDVDKAIGVCSDSIGIMLGGAGIPSNRRIEVELLGKIWTKTNDEIINAGDFVKVVADGTVTKTTNKYEKFGIALTAIKDGKVRILYK